jgi:hypothetical protein
VQARLAGRHDRLGRAELESIMRRVVRADPGALLGLDRFAQVDVDEARAAAQDIWGWDPAANAVAIDPDRLLGAALAARSRVVDVARRGGRVLVATGRPASLLGIHQGFARLARRSGAHVLEADEAGPVAVAGRPARVWWVGGVAVLTDGADLLADLGTGAIEEVLFAVPHPDLVVADRGFAGGALRIGIEVVALAGLESVALGIAARRGQPVTVVPVHEHRPAAAYVALEPLLGASGQPAGPPADPPQAS